MRRCKAWVERVVAVGGLLLLAPLGCGSDDEEGAAGGGDGKTPYGPPTKTTTFLVRSVMPEQPEAVMPAAWVGTKQIGGKTFDRLFAGYEENGEPKGTEVWVNKGQDTYEVGGATEHEVLTVEFDEPVVVNMNPPVRQPQTITASGMVTTVDDPTPKPGTGTLTYELLTTSASVETDLGMVHGCSHYQGQMTVEGEGVPDFMKALTLEIEVWHHPNLGFVAGKMPGLGAEFGLAGSRDYGSATSGTNIISAMDVLSAENRNFKLNTYDAHGDFDADKNSHAKMMIELRWLDEEKAKTSDMPYVETEFGTIFGIYPHQLVELPVTFFHPHENGKGYRYWIAYVDQAAKNESENGIAYHVSAYYDFDEPVRVTSRIVYQLYKP